VKRSRAGKLAGPESALFSGEYWAGGKAKELGLVDALGDLRSHLRARFGDKVETPLIAERGWFGRRLAGVSEPSLSGLLTRPGMADEIVSAIEARALWARYGL
jgi:serine protease SohB